MNYNNYNNRKREYDERENINFNRNKFNENAVPENDFDRGRNNNSGVNIYRKPDERVNERGFIRQYDRFIQRSEERSINRSDRRIIHSESIRNFYRSTHGVSQRQGDPKQREGQNNVNFRGNSQNEQMRGYHIYEDYDSRNVMHRNNENIYENNQRANNFSSNNNYSENWNYQKKISNDESEVNNDNEVYQKGIQNLSQRLNRGEIRTNRSIESRIKYPYKDNNYNNNLRNRNIESNDDKFISYYETIPSRENNNESIFDERIIENNSYNRDYSYNEPIYRGTAERDLRREFYREPIIDRDFSYEEATEGRKNIWKTVYQWFIFAIIFQFLCFFFIENVYLKRNPGNNQIKIIEDSQDYEQELDNVEFSLKPGGEEPRVSYDASYVAQFNSNSIIIYSVKDKKEIKSIKIDGYDLTYYTWLPDRNMILYAGKAINPTNNKNIHYASYDVDNGQTRVISDDPRGQQFWPNIQHGWYIIDITFSPSKNIFYIKIVDDNENFRICRQMVMNDVYYTDLHNVINPVHMRQLNYKWNLVMEGKDGKIAYWDGDVNQFYNISNTVPVISGKKMALLGLDENDIVYLGEVGSDTRVTKIYRGNIPLNNTSSWSEYAALKKAVDRDKIVIEGVGVYVVDTETGTLRDVKMNTSFNYKGLFLGFKNNYIVTLKDEVVKLEKLKK